MKKITLFLIAFISIQIGFAAESKKQDVEKALKLTQQMLKDPEAIKQQTSKSPEAKNADAKVKEIAGSSENEQAIYELAASVFANLVQQSGGNFEQMQRVKSAWNSTVHRV